MRRGAITLLYLACLVGSSGCGLTQTMNSMTHFAKKTFTFRSTDAEDPTEMEDDAWITDAADEARGDRPREKDPDQWYKKYLMSEKARSIERNLGFD